MHLPALPQDLERFVIIIVLVIAIMMMMKMISVAGGAKNIVKAWYCSISRDLSHSCKSDTIIQNTIRALYRSLNRAVYWAPILGMAMRL